MNDPRKIPRRRNTACTRLADKFGGTWKYFGFCRWFECDDGRRVYRVATGYCDEWDNYVRGPIKYAYSVDHSDVTKIIRPKGYWW